MWATVRPLCLGIFGEHEVEQLNTVAIFLILFLEGRKNFSHPESHSKISFYPHFLNMKRGSLPTRSFTCIHHSVSRFRLSTNGFAGPNGSRTCVKRAPGFCATDKVNVYQTKVKPKWEVTILSVELINCSSEN